jgi:hypothetical protein
VALATVIGAAAMGFCCGFGGQWQALTAWTVAMACVYVLVRASGAAQLTTTRRIQVILAAFLSFLATIGATTAYWGRAMRFEAHAPSPACPRWLALLAAAVAWFLVARRKGPSANNPTGDDPGSNSSRAENPEKSESRCGRRAVTR